MKNLNVKKKLLASFLALMLALVLLFQLFKTSQTNDEEKYEISGLNESSCDKIDFGGFLRMVRDRANAKGKTFLEIGPYANPLDGVLNAKYFDRLDREAIIKAVLVEKVVAINADSVPQKIDYVSATGDLGIVTDTFDYVFSKYNIEHQFDLVEHLNKVYDILNENGRYFAIIPDKRYMFDYFNSDTHLSDVLSSHYVKEKKYSLNIWLQTCERTIPNPDKHWHGDHGTDIYELRTNFDCYKSYIDSYLNKKSRTEIEVNSHQWRFHPRSFFFIVDSLNKMGLTKLKVDKIYCTNKDDFNFYVVLKK